MNSCVEVVAYVSSSRVRRSRLREHDCDEKQDCHNEFTCCFFIATFDKYNQVIATKNKMARKQTPKAVVRKTTSAVAAPANGDIVGRQHAQQLELLRSVYNEAPETVWQGAATRALEVNALLMAAVVGEQQRTVQDRNGCGRGNDKDKEAAKTEESGGDNDNGDDNGDDTQGDEDRSSDCDSDDSSSSTRGDDEDDDDEDDE